MESLKLSFQVIMPLFFMMALGYTLKRVHLTDKDLINGVNKLVFKIFLPLTVLDNIYKTDPLQTLDWKLIGFVVVSVFVLFIALCLLVPLFEKEHSRCGVLVQGIFRSNFVIFGIPVAEGIFGEGNIPVTIILVAIVTPIFNMLAVICLEIFRSGRIDVKQIVKKVLLNPLIIASCIGILIVLLKIRLPQVVSSTMGSLSKVTTPLALVALGGSFVFGDVKPNLKQILFGVGGKLLLISAVFLPIAVFLMGFRGEALVALMILFSAPTSISSYSMAAQMGGDDTLAGQLVVFSSIFSVATVFMWVSLLRFFGWI